MVFSQSSDISVVVTSCGRFELLKRTLASLDRFNTTPIRRIVITEDSGDRAVEACIPEHWREHTQFFINVPRLGQLRSIDLAYEQVQTPWIFHCEDDWEFYREGFIEDSRLLLEADPQALQVWLRSYRHDLAIHSPYVFLNARQVRNGVPFYVVGSHKSDWQGFSLNPGLRRLADYLKHAPYAGFSGEKALSRTYAEENRYALIVENDAVLHTGFDGHVEVPEERADKQRRRRRAQVKLLAALVVGLALGWFAHGV